MKNKVLLLVTASDVTASDKLLSGPKLHRGISELLLSDSRYEAEVVFVCDEDEGHEDASTAHLYTTLKNPQDLGYGGDKKIGFRYGLREGFDFIVALHASSLPKAETLHLILAPLLEDEAEAVFAYTTFENKRTSEGFVSASVRRLSNKLLGAERNSLHYEYQAFSASTLRQLPFEQNSQDASFDEELVIQCHLAGRRVLELEIQSPKPSTPVVSARNSQILKAAILSRLQKWSIFYAPRFDLQQENQQYENKFDFPSSHSMAVEALPADSQVLNLGCGSVELVRPFVEHARELDAVDLFVSPELRKLVTQAEESDLNTFRFSKLNREKYDAILLLDIIEHLHSPENFLRDLRAHEAFQGAEILISTPNIAFFTQRLMLLFGFFNYGKRGILDRTHCRLFTFDSLRRMLSEQGFSIEQVRGVPAPFPLALGRGRLANFFLMLNSLLITLSKSLFSFQIFMVVRANPTVDSLLERAEKNTEKKKVVSSRE